MGPQGDRSSGRHAAIFIRSARSSSRSIATGFFIYIRFQYGFSPLERYYLPYYFRGEMAVSRILPALSIALCFG